MEIRITFMFIFFFCLNSLNLFSENSNIIQQVVTANWSNPETIILPTDSGTTNVICRYFPSDWQYQNDKMSVFQAVYIPESGMFWMGWPCQHIVVMKDKIVGIYSWSSLHFRVSKKIIADKGLIYKESDLHRQKPDFMVGDWDKLDPAKDKEISLKSIVGKNALIKEHETKMPKPAEITGISVTQTGLTIFLKTEINKQIVLSLNENLNPVSATVDGKQVFSRSNEGTIGGTNRISSQSSTNKVTK